jgi:hypothetical protein
MTIASFLLSIRWPPRTFMAQGMVFLLLHFSWTWVGLFVSKDFKGFQILPERRDGKKSICLASVEMITFTTASHFPIA